MSHTHKSKHEIKHCPRCQLRFECKVSNIMHCPCVHIELSQETTDYLRDTEYDCLCPDCLHELNDLIQRREEVRFPSRPHEFVEGLHYYTENGNWVFTEFYHLLRGKCCQSGCRHCAYGFQKPEKTTL